MPVACAACQKEGRDLFLCSGCEAASYCRIDCQSADWPTHQPSCTAEVQKKTEARAKSHIHARKERGRAGRPLPVAEMEDYVRGGAQLLARGEVDSAIENVTLGLAFYKNAVVAGKEELERQLEEEKEAVVAVADLLEIRSLALMEVRDMEKVSEDCMQAYSMLVGGEERRRRMREEAEAALLLRAVKFLVRAAHTVKKTNPRCLACYTLAEELLEDWAATAGEVTEEIDRYRACVRRERETVLLAIGTHDWTSLQEAMSKGKMNLIEGPLRLHEPAVPYACSFPRFLAPTPVLLPKGLRKRLHNGTTIDYLVKGPSDPFLLLDTVVNLIAGEHQTPGMVVGERMASFTSLKEAAATLPKERPRQSDVLFKGTFEWQEGVNEDGRRAAMALWDAILSLASRTGGKAKAKDVINVLFLIFSDVVPISAAQLASKEKVGRKVGRELRDPVWRFARMLADSQHPVLSDASMQLDSAYQEEILSGVAVANPTRLEYLRVDMWACLRDTIGRGSSVNEEQLMEQMREQYERVSGWLLSLYAVPVTMRGAVVTSPTKDWGALTVNVLSETAAFAPDSEFLYAHIEGSTPPFPAVYVAVLPARLTGLSLKLVDRHLGDTDNAICELTGLSVGDWFAYLQLDVEASEPHPTGAAVLTYERHTMREISLPYKVLLGMVERMVVREDEPVIVQGVAVRKPPACSSISVILSLTTALDNLVAFEQGLAAMMEQLQGRRGCIARGKLHRLLVTWLKGTGRTHVYSCLFPDVIIKPDGREHLRSVSQTLLRPLESSLRACLIRQPYREGLFQATIGLTNESRIVSMPVTKVLHSLPAGSVEEAAIRPLGVEFSSEDGDSVLMPRFPMVQVTRIRVPIRADDLQLGRCASLVVFSRYSEEIVYYGCCSELMQDP